VPPRLRGKTAALQTDIKPPIPRQFHAIITQAYVCADSIQECWGSGTKPSVVFEKFITWQDFTSKPLELGTAS